MRKTGQNLNGQKKSCRRFLEKESWEGNFMCGQAKIGMDLSFFKKMSFNI